MSEKSALSNLKKPLKKNIQRLRKRGFSFREIARCLDTSVKTAWRHGKVVNFSENGKHRYETEVTGVEKKISKQKDFITKEKA
ncbi:hypothetical protein AKJ51_02075 [candidate division MSBL1 archaeon SCGC-AAA382A20]|uniref:Resolvase HTH domain-containing protein n=2 Tax=candidate division MSBL1 TaxID=215777 RepID=A0A133VKY1_9EURY|nr:hypothetical protein AKJ50_01685 [candidate division MSBL1 archaeon SCGC-AAA382A13]KXB07085.1 hypothetical protein AKJ51_02075 [candidate division MSBL1 archaeon SCGC-AAA382A20]